MANNDLIEFQFLSLNHKSAWNQGQVYDLQAADEGIRLRETFQYQLERNIFASDFPMGKGIANAVVGSCQLIYILDKNGSIYVYNVQQSRFDSIDWLSSYTSGPAHIAYSPGSIYVSDGDGEKGIFHFAEVNWQMTWNRNFGKGSSVEKLEVVQPLIPTDMAADQNGHLYMLDAAQGCIVQFDKGGRFVAVFGGEELKGKKPIALSVTSFGEIYILDQQDKKVLTFKRDDKTGNFTKTAEISIPLRLPSGLGVDSKGFIFIGENKSITDGAEDRFVHIFNREGKKISAVYAYRGAVDKIILDECDRLYVLNKEEQKVSILHRQPTFFKRPDAPLANGVFTSTALDSTKQGMKWHKLILDADIPENTQIEVSYLISDQKIFYYKDELRNIDSFILDKRISLANKELALPWSEPQVNPRDMLVHGEGRYLWLKVRLIGSERETPVVKSIQAVFPRTSYLRYLPAVFQEDKESSDFLERYLSLFETFLSDSERRIDRIAKWFDINAVSGEYLRWLASWLSVAYNENWPEDKLRILLHRIPELYKKRGTRDGIEEMIEIFTGDRPFIVEQFQLKCVKDEEVLELLSRLYGNDPYSFCVLLKPGQIRTKGDYLTVRQILETEKPAHTHAGLTVLEPWIYLDQHTYLGINTVLSEPDPRIGTAVIQRDTVLADPIEYGQIQVKSGLNTDTILA